MTMQLQLIRKGATYAADCATCGATQYTHEWIESNHKGRRDAMQKGALLCGDCARGCTDPKTFYPLGKQYACRYLVPGYLDCTDWHFGKNKRKLMAHVRQMYG